MKADRGDHVTGSLTDQAYDLLDALQKIAKELSSKVAAVSLAWVPKPFQCDLDDYRSAHNEAA
jgi:aryl-alcohol dehydrogenase-like predicted oxidoreductase